MESLAYTKSSNKPFATVADSIEKNSADNQFRVLAVHNVQETLAEKGFERGPLKIIEVCNAGFAHKALQKDVDVAMFMPCRFTVYTEGDKTMVTLARPSMIADMLPGKGLEELAQSVESTLKKVLEDSI